MIIVLDKLITLTGSYGEGINKTVKNSTLLVRPKWEAQVYDSNNLNLCLAKIKIKYIEQLNQIRFNLKGEGFNTGTTFIRKNFKTELLNLYKPTTATNLDGSKNSSCKGYKFNGYVLDRDLNFDKESSYAKPNEKFDSSNFEFDESATNTIYEVMRGVDENKRGWLPIGYSKYGLQPFNSIIEGNWNTIYNLYISRQNVDDVAFIAWATGFVKIENLTLINLTIKGSYNTASLVGELDGGNIDFVNVQGSIFGIDGDYIGGLVGDANGEISNSQSNVQIIASKSNTRGSEKDIANFVGWYCREYK